MTNDLWSRPSRSSHSIRAAARTLVFFLKVLPMLPSRPLNWVTVRPTVATLSYPTSSGIAHGQVYRPSTPGPHPGGEALARSGFAALLYWSPTMRDLRLDPEDIDNIARAYDRLLQEPAVDPGHSGLLGTCVGGSFALMAAAHPLIRERVAFLCAFGPYASMRSLAIGIASSTRESGHTRALADEVAAQVGPIEVAFAERHRLVRQVRRQDLGDARFGQVGGRHPARPDQSRIQIPQPMALVTVDTLRAALAPVAHLRILQADAPLLGYPPAQPWSLRGLRHILRHHVVGRGRGRRQHLDRGLLPGRGIVPVQLQGCLQARAADDRGPGLDRQFRQPPPLLTGQHAERLPQGVT